MAEPFFPMQTFSATAGNATAVAVKLKDAGSPCTVRIAIPAATALMYVKFGDSTVQATGTDMPFLPGAIEVFQLMAGQTHMSVLSSGASNTVYATTGLGA